MQIQAAIAYGQSFPEPSESVEAMTAAVGKFQKSFSTIAEVVAPESLELRNETEGRVTAVNFKSGARVTRGEVLVQLDISEESARLKAARASAELTRLELERAQRLVKKKLASQETLDRAQADYDIAKANIAALKANIDKKTLRAPFDAIAGIHDLNTGEYLEGNTAIVTLTGINDYVWLDFNVPLEHSSVSTGTEISLDFPGNEEASLTARIAAKDTEASASSRNIKYRARIDLSSGEHPLRVPPNGVLKVTIPLKEIELMQLPRAALLIDEKGEYVYTLTKDANAGPKDKAYRAQRRPVEVKDRDSKVVTISAGVKPDELIAVHGAFKLAPGMLTHVRERTATDSAGE